MLKEGYIIGGEQSGHIIFKRYSTTGDGQLSAVQLLSILKRSGEKLSKISNIMEQYPQVMINITINNDMKSKLNDDSEVKLLIEKCQNCLSDNGRILVRASGTEPLIRVMVEGKEFDTINKYAVMIADKIKRGYLKLCALQKTGKITK